MIPGFTDEGVLPPGVHEATLEEVKRDLGFSRRRRELTKGLESALTLMGNCGIESVYLDGSFVTEKPRPGDIDCCYDVPSGANLAAMFPIWPLTSNNRLWSQKMFNAEFFPSDMIERGSGQPFLRFFQSDSEGNPKGIVSIRIGR